LAGMISFCLIFRFKIYHGVSLHGEASCSGILARFSNDVNQVKIAHEGAAFRQMTNRPPAMDIWKVVFEQANDAMLRLLVNTFEWRWNKSSLETIVVLTILCHCYITSKSIKIDILVKK